MAGLVPENKAHRVYNYQRKTIMSALEIIGALGLEHPDELQPWHIYKRVASNQVLSYRKQYPIVLPGSLLHGTASDTYLQKSWDRSAVNYKISH